MTVRTLDWKDERALAWWHLRYDDGALYHNTFFQSPEWIHAWKRHYVDTHPRRKSLLIAVEEKGTLLALAPLFLHERSIGPLRVWRSLHLIGERLAQYADIVTDTKDTKAIWTAIIGYLHAEYPDAWLELRDVLPESTAYWLADSADTEGEWYYRLPLHGLTPESLEGNAQAHMRRELSRARKRLSTDTALTWQFVTAPDASLLSELVRLNRKRFGTDSWFESGISRDYFFELCQAALKETWCAVLRSEERIASMLMGHSHGGCLLYLLSGIDEEFRSLSPGTMNLGRTIAYAAEQGFAYFDFLRGDEQYKCEFNPEARRSRHIVILAPKAGTRKRLAESMRKFVQYPGGESTRA
jgi:CelD/BcsL family acetyltransferase involved in cellulose biosynthesis